MTKQLKEKIAEAAGRKKADLVLKNAVVVNVFTETLEKADVAICGDTIVGVGSYEGEEEVDLEGKYLCPGFLDGHIHLESSMLLPGEFEKAVLPHGTTGVFTDPHEIANVAGTRGIDFMMEQTKGLTMDVFFMLPSCVPASPMEEAGAVLTARELKPYYGCERVAGLAEVMDAFGTVAARDDVLEKLEDARLNGKRLDGHAPGLSGNLLNAYVTAGIGSDHECSTPEEGIEKISRGQWVMIREGTAARNLEALLPLCKAPFYTRCMFVTDDRHPEGLRSDGHMDAIIRKAVNLGVNPIQAIRMATLHTAQYFGKLQLGAVAPGYHADLVVLSDLEKVKVTDVYKNGKKVTSQVFQSSIPVKEIEKKYPEILHSFHMETVTPQDLALKREGEKLRVIELIPGEILTRENVVPYTVNPGYAKGVDISKDIIKVAVLERHHHTGHIGIGFLKGYGLKEGAVATSVAHDTHNLIVTGVNDEDMALAANTVREQEGGLALVKNGEILGTLPLPVGGLMSLWGAQKAEDTLEELKRTAAALGCKAGIDPFMTLAFISLPVIPCLRLNGLGLIDVQKQAVEDCIF